MIDEERLVTCKSVGKTPQEAFAKIWDLMQFREDCCLKKISDNEWHIKIVIVPPTLQDMQRFEDYGI